MEYNGIEIPRKVDFDLVLTPPAVEKLQSYSLLSATPDELARWNIEHLPFYIDFPYIRFHHKKIPVAFNHPGIVVYLGFTQNVGVDIFMDLYATSKKVPARNDTMAAVHNYINAKWAARIHEGAAIGTPMAETVMTEIGLTPEVRAEVNTLHLEFERNPGIFQEYFDNHHDKNIDNVQMVDMIHVLIDNRMKKLEKLNGVVLLMLH